MVVVGAECAAGLPKEGCGTEEAHVVAVVDGVVGRGGGRSGRCPLADGGLKPVVVVVGAECAAGLPKEGCGDGRSTLVAVVDGVVGRGGGRRWSPSGEYAVVVVDAGRRGGRR